jgi:hypothetical protein
VCDEIGDELEPVGGGIEDVSIGKRDENPAGELGEGGFGDVAADAPASGMAARGPDAAIDLHGHLGSGPGEISAVGGRPTGSEAFLLLKCRPRNPDRQDVFALEGQVWEGDQPLVGKGFLQMAGARHGQQ